MPLSNLGIRLRRRLPGQAATGSSAAVVGDEAAAIDGTEAPAAPPEAVAGDPHELARENGPELPADDPPPALVKRVDPVPPMQPFPDRHYVIVVDTIPRNHAGRTASILNKTRLFYERLGVESTILVVDYSSQLDDLTHQMRGTGELADGVCLVNLLDHLPDDSHPVAVAVTHEIAEPGLHPIIDKTGLYRYFDDAGVYRLYKRFDYAGRLLLRDHFQGNRLRTRRDEYRLDGTIARSAFMNSETNRPSQDIYYRRDGTPLLNVWLGEHISGHEPVVRRVTHFDAAGKPERTEMSVNGFLHTCLDNVLAEKPTVLSVEARRWDNLVLTYDRPWVRKVFVLHNAHISPPYDDVAQIRPVFQPIMTAHTEPDALVFLTNTQRAEAEQLLGRQENFRVIPHSAHQPPEPIEPVERDPDLVIMMARLNSQKRVEHAVWAFSRVLERRPEARLEIYGRGPELKELRELSKWLKVQGSVKFMGFIKDPSSVYRRASLCIMTSRFEGAPLTVLESFMHGCPVISYDLKYGPPDMITDGENGFLIPSGDRVAMADKIVEVLSDEDLRTRLSAGTATAAANFGEDAFLARWSGLFHDLVDAKDTPDAS